MQPHPPPFPMHMHTHGGGAGAGWGVEEEWHTPSVPVQGPGGGLDPYAAADVDYLGRGRGGAPPPPRTRSPNANKRKLNATQQNHHAGLAGYQGTGFDDSIVWEGAAVVIQSLFRRFQLRKGWKVQIKFLKQAAEDREYLRMRIQNEASKYLSALLTEYIQEDFIPEILMEVLTDDTDSFAPLSLEEQLANALVTKIVGETVEEELYQMFENITKVIHFHNNRSNCFQYSDSFCTPITQLLWQTMVSEFLVTVTKYHHPMDILTESLLAEFVDDECALIVPEVSVLTEHSFFWQYLP
jgi:hypothetical protein